MNSQPGSDRENPDESVNRDELLDMVHTKRGLPPGSEVPGRPTRITHHEIKALKTTTTTKGNSPVAGLAKFIGGILGSIGGLFSAILPARKTSNKTRCNLNGHVYPRNWKGDFPVCTHCGKTIKSPDEFRSGQGGG